MDGLDRYYLLHTTHFESFALPVQCIVKKLDALVLEGMWVYI